MAFFHLCSLLIYCNMGQCVGKWYAYAPVAQLDRVPGYELGGRRFESFRARQVKNHTILAYE